MTPLPDRVVILGLILGVALCFALAFWAARVGSGSEPPMLWRTAPASRPAGPVL
jgi:hypothetical protein